MIISPAGFLPRNYLKRIWVYFQKKKTFLALKPLLKSLLQGVVLPAFHVKLLKCGPFADRFGIQLGFLITGISCLLMSLLGFFSADIMKMENKPAEEVQHVISSSA